MKYLWLYILLLFILVILVVYARLLLILNSFDYDYKISNYDLSKINIQNYYSNQNLEVEADIEVFITNKSTFSMKLTNVYVDIYDNKGNLILKSVSDNVDLSIVPKSKSSFKSKVKLIVSTNTVVYIADFVLSRGGSIGYKFRAKYLGLPISFKSNYIASF